MTEGIKAYKWQTLPQLNPANQLTPAQVQQSFAEHLGNAMDTLNTSQIKADNAIERLVSGEAKNLHNVMITMQKAELTLQTAIEVRNKAVKAYKDVMHMQI